MRHLDLKKYIREVNNFPKEGIVFKDITTLLKDPEAFREMGKQVLDFAQDKQIEKVAGIDSRGFIYGGYLADKLNAGLVLIRKKGKLPAETYQTAYNLEYGSATIELHKDAIAPGERVLLHDDLLATGGTAKAACQLIEKAGGKVVQISFLLELAALGGRERFKAYDLRSVLRYD